VSPNDAILSLKCSHAPGRESGIVPLRSLYDEFLASLPSKSIETIKTREPKLEGRKGGNEPIFTSYTHFWKSTLGQSALGFSFIFEQVLQIMCSCHLQRGTERM